MDPNELAELLKARRLAKGWTMRTLAAKAKVDHSYIGHMEKGRKNPTIDILRKLAAALDVEVDALVEMPPNALDEAREQVAARFLAILPRLTQDEVDLFIHDLDFWEKRHPR